MKKVLLWITWIVTLTSPASAITVTDYLIDTNIGQYSRSFPGACSEGSGIIMGAGHFDLDHADFVCDLRYFNKTIPLGVEVQVTQHSGSDSDRWLLHEVEDGYRSNPEQDKFKGVLREIEGNRIFTYPRGTHYSWVNNNVVIDIKYTDLQKAKPEPIEVVTAYLRKFPSTIPVMAMDRAHDEQWIKSEMDRRLWLGDKWFLQIQTGKADTGKVLKESVDHMGVFLDYRQKYFGMDSLEEKKALSGFQQKQDGTAIKKKLAEYKTWWEANKGRAINLP